MEKAITFLSFAVSIITLLFVYRQVKDASKATTDPNGYGASRTMNGEMRAALASICSARQRRIFLVVPKREFGFRL